MCMTSYKKKMTSQYILNQVNSSILGYGSLVLSQGTCFHYLKAQRTIKIPV